MSGVTTETLEKEIAEILKKANLATTSTKKVRQQLEKKLGVDLASERKKIDQLVMKYVNSKEDDEEPEDEEDDASEEEEKKPAKRPPTKAAKKRKPSSEEEVASEGSESEEEKKPSPKKKARGKKRGDSDDDWGKDKKGKKAGGGGAGGRGKGGGYTRAYKLSPQLAELMGETELPRHEVVKRVWAMIKEKQLYDPNNKQFAICDAPLLKVIGTSRFRTFGMMKYLKNHFISD